MKIKERIKAFVIENERYIKTFIEAFGSYIAVNALVTDFTSKSALYGLIAGAIGSAISVIFNYSKNK